MAALRGGCREITLATSLCTAPGQPRCLPRGCRAQPFPLFPAGDLLIIMAQVIVAIQMVLEEKFVYKHDVHPLRAVGTEGLLLCGAGLRAFGEEALLKGLQYGEQGVLMGVGGWML